MHKHTPDILVGRVRLYTKPLERTVARPELKGQKM